MTKAFDGIAAGLEDAIAFARGDLTRGRVVARPASRDGEFEPAAPFVELADVEDELEDWDPEEDH